LRILPPWLLLGIFIIAPPQVYLERLSQGQFSGNFFQFYPHYFDGVYGFGGNFAVVPPHLWYLVYLFLFSLLFLPLFLPGRESGESLIARIASRFERPWAILLLGLPLVLTIWLGDTTGLGWTRQMGGWDILSYILFFIYGYLIFSRNRIHQVIEKHRVAFLAVALALTIFGLMVRFWLEPQGNWSVQFGSPQYFGVLILMALRTWC